jgi:hypothetical protein
MENFMDRHEGLIFGVVYLAAAVVVVLDMFVWVR